MVSELDIGTIEQQQNLDALNEQGRGRPWSPAFIQGKQGEFVKWSVDQEDVLANLHHNLRGEIKVSGIWKKTGMAVMSEEGINAYMGFIAERYHKGLIMGNLDAVQVKRIINEVCHMATDFVLLNFTRYQIRPEQFDNLAFTAKHLMEYGLSRAQGANEKRWISTIQQIREVIGGTQSQAKQGFMNKMFGGGNNGGAMNT